MPPTSQPNLNPDYEIMDVENYRNEDVVFSHQALVMRAMNKTIELGSKELIEGFYDETQTGKAGTTKIIYKEDTRRAFIEAVKTCKMIMVCDFDSTAKEKIKKLTKKIKEKKAQLLKDQKIYWNSLKYEQKLQMLKTIGSEPHPLFFHQQLPFWNLFIDEELLIYRRIFEQLSKLTSRLKFYTTKKGEA